MPPSVTDAPAGTRLSVARYTFTRDALEVGPTAGRCSFKWTTEGEVSYYCGGQRTRHEVASTPLPQVLASACALPLYGRKAVLDDTFEAPDGGRYELVAVVEHLQEGHFVCDVLVRGDWYRYNYNFLEPTSDPSVRGPRHDLTMAVWLRVDEE